MYRTQIFKKGEYIHFKLHLIEGGYGDKNYFKFWDFFLEFM